MTTSEQARADALADAETLRLNVPLPKALVYGNRAVNTATRTDWAASTHATVAAIEAARAAFRAVPGLRG